MSPLVRPARALAPANASRRPYSFSLLLLGLLASTAEAGGIARPNTISARGVSLGGAFVAVADDATAWHFNPSGTAFAEPGVHIGVELVIAPRTYKPLDPAVPEQSPNTPIIPLPALGVVVEVGDRVKVGGGVWNTFGGSLTYEKEDPPLRGVIDQSQNAVIEAVAGIGYKVNDRVAIGAAARLGVGLFSVKTTQKPVDSDLSAMGVGIGATLGMTWRASPKLTVGVNWRSGLKVRTTGDGAVMLPAGPLPVEVVYVQGWPQSAALGTALAISPRVMWAVELDWTQWSSFETLDVTFPGTEQLNQSYPLDWDDSYAVRSGVQWKPSAGFALRGGIYFDSNAVPDRTIERQYLDRDKVGVSLGVGLGSGAWHLDLGVDATGGAGRTVPDNSADVGGFPSLANANPGEYSGLLVTLETALVRRL